MMVQSVVVDNGGANPRAQTSLRDAAPQIMESRCKGKSVAVSHRQLLSASSETSNCIGSTMS
jgi:hypothetical protein